MPLTTQWSRIEQMQGEAGADAWQWFVDRYRSFVAAALHRMIWSRERADAASEEFWGYLFQADVIGRLRRGMQFRGFLVSTLRNYAHDWLRRNPRLAPPATAAAAERQDEHALLHEDEELALWARQILHLALQRLGREHPRHAAVLQAFYGVTPNANGQAASRRTASEIAAEHGLAANALHQLLFRARARLRECVIEEVRQTVSTKSDLESELCLLTAALGKVMPGLV